MVVDGVQHCYACPLRQLPPVIGEWTAEARTVRTGFANKTMMDTYVNPTVRRRYRVQCVLYSKPAVYALQAPECSAMCK